MILYAPRYALVSVNDCDSVSHVSFIEDIESHVESRSDPSTLNVSSFDESLYALIMYVYADCISTLPVEHTTAQYAELISLLHA